MDNIKNENTDLEPKKLKKVIKGTVELKEESLGSRFIRTFISNDISAVKKYVANDVIMPALKNMVWSAFSNGLHMLFFGNPGSNANKSSSLIPGSSIQIIDYSSQSRKQAPDPIPTYKYNDALLFSNYEDAQTVLLQMQDAIDIYHRVTVNDLYDFVGLTGTSTDLNYGWCNIDNAKILPDSGRYRLKLPKPIVLPK